MNARKEKDNFVAKLFSLPFWGGFRVFAALIVNSALLLLRSSM